MSNRRRHCRRAQLCDDVIVCVQTLCQEPLKARAEYEQFGGTEQDGGSLYLSPLYCSNFCRKINVCLCLQSNLGLRILPLSKYATITPRGSRLWTPTRVPFRLVLYMFDTTH